MMTNVTWIGLLKSATYSVDKFRRKEFSGVLFLARVAGGLHKIHSHSCAKRRVGFIFVVYGGHFFAQEEVKPMKLGIEWRSPWDQAA